MTTDLGNRQIYSDGTVICQQTALIERLYAGDTLAGLFCADLDDQIEWQIAAKLSDDNAAGPDHATGELYSDIDWYQHWITPEPYCSIDLEAWCISKCTTDVERNRVLFELAEMQQRNMYPLIRHLIYCADRWRKHNIVWGVGRGSSVCSFVLYLTGINRINPLEHDLDLAEWLK